MNAFELRPGVIIDPARRQGYIMSPDGGIDAVDLAQGKLVWSTKAADKPLGIAGDLLIGQAERSDAANKMQVVALKAGNGEQVVTGTRDLPVNVKASVTETLDGEFVARARPSEGDVVVSWQYFGRPITGIAPAEEEPPAPERVAEQMETRSGAFRMNLSSGAMAPLDEALAETRGPRAALIPMAERLPGIPEPQFLSADGRHVLVSKRTGDDSVWDRFTLTIYDRSTRERVGEFKCHLSHVPFTVLDSRVIYETGPYTRRTKAGLVEEPLKIRAVDLQSGKELWSRQVRDTTYRGPFPP